MNLIEQMDEYDLMYGLTTQRKEPSPLESVCVDCEYRRKKYKCDGCPEKLFEALNCENEEGENDDL